MREHDCPVHEVQWTSFEQSGRKISYLVHALHMIADEIAVRFLLRASYYSNWLTKTSAKHDEQLETACHLASFLFETLCLLFAGVNDKE